MNDWGEAGVVIGWNLSDLAGPLGLLVDVGIGTAHKPEYRRHMPFRSEAAKILACCRRLGLLDSFGGEVFLKGIADAPGCLGVISDESITVQDRDLRRLCR